MATADTNPPAIGNLTPSCGDQMSALKRKAEHAKKGELVREIHKMSVQIQALEREKLTHIFSKRSDFRQEFTCLQEEDTKLADERKTEKVKVRQQLEKISHMVKRFHRELRDVKATPEFVEKLKTIMEEIETAINSFKEQQRLKYEELLKSEKTLFQELQQLEQKFESWAVQQTSQAQENTARAGSARSIINDFDVAKDLPPEVAAFDKFVHQSSGHRGGWDEYDHQTFLKFRNRYKGRIVFLDYLRPRLPTRTETEMREHEAWYQEYLFLQENKKYAIKKWRERKEEEKEDALTQVQGELESARERETKKQATPALTLEEKTERAKQINAWKVQRELEKAMKEERKIKEELEKKKKQEDDKKRHLEAKKKVDEFRQQKQLEEEVLNMLEEERKKEERDKRREVIAKEVGRFQSRDAQRLKEKLDKEREKEEIKREKDRKLEASKNQVYVPRDPNRLMQPTAGWKERLKNPRPTGGGPVLNMPHRAVPSWRQGLM